MTREYGWGAAGLMQVYYPLTPALASFSFDPAGNEVSRLWSGTSGVSDIAVTDAYGIVLDVSASTGTSITPPDPVGFGGQFGNYTDWDTGLVLMGHRYYDPGKARFLTRDPIGYNGGINVYAYCENNPIRWIDPSGLAIPPLSTVLQSRPNNGFWRLIGGLAGGILGAVLTPELGGAGAIPGAAAGSAVGSSFDGDSASQSFQNGAVDGVLFTAGPLGGEELDAAFAAIGNARTGVQPFEIGIFSDLKDNELVGDGLEIHHIPQGNPAEQVVPGYVYEEGVAIALPTRVHRTLPATPRLTGPYTGSARSLISIQLRDLHQAGLDREVMIELAKNCERPTQEYISDEPRTYSKRSNRYFRSRRSEDGLSEPCRIYRWSAIRHTERTLWTLRNMVSVSS